MSILPIITGADAPILRKKAQDVLQVNREILKLIKDMEDTVHDANGLGLAAPQVGVSLRLCIIQFNHRFLPLINPTITSRSTQKSTAEEGCLSLPGIGVNVERSQDIIVQFLDTKGMVQERNLADLDARVVQHELDHLDGILITDYLPSLGDIPLRREEHLEAT